jgi:hypothetical protein
MKTNKLSIVALTGMSAIMLLSCKKDVNTPTSSSEAAKGTISGIAYAELDETAAGKEFAPNGTKVLARLNETNSYSYSGTITDGKYSISIPAGRKARDYTISFENFTATKTFADGSKNVINFKTADVPVVGLIGSLNISKNVDYIIDYNNNDLNQIVTFKGTAKYDGDITDGNSNVNNVLLNTLINVPDGTKVYLKTTAGKIYVTSVLAGQYQFLISTPAAENVDCTITFDNFRANQVEGAVTTDKVFSVGANSITAAAGSIKLIDTRFN